MQTRDFVPRLLSAVKSAFAFILFGVLLAGCGGGGGGGSSAPGAPQVPATLAPGAPTSPFTGPATGLVATASTAWLNPSQGLFSDFVVDFAQPNGDDAFEVFFYNFFNDAAIVSPQELVQAKLFVQNTAPYPAAAGSIFAYIQFIVTPDSIALAPSEYFQLSSETHVTLVDPLGIPPGKFVGCTVYAGSHLIGSGSNAQLSELGPGPGFLCNTANHGNSTGAPGFALPTIQAGTIYTVVYSLES